MDNPNQPKLLSHTDTNHSGLTFLERRLRSLLTNLPRRAVTVTEDPKGALGLNLLYEPAETHVDLVFIHGLRGGSRKTWCNSEDPSQLWPKEWLPAEPGLENVRILSYGYKSDWAERKGNVLNIHDFALDLLASLGNHPQMRQSETVPLVLVGHSMGGLVIKKFYLLATRDPNYEQLADRVHSMFFLGTPHRGADSAQLLSNILSAAGADKSYVNDLIPNSGLLQSINDEFRHVYQDVNVWSFYETLKTSLGYSQDLIVPKDSAVMSLPGERTQPMNADHRHVCKFTSSLDPNYIIIRNALLKTVEDIEMEMNHTRVDQRREHLKLISHYISASNRPDADLANIKEHKIEGSCMWLTTRPSFLSWQFGQHEEKDTAPLNIFFLSGKPGTGKSVMAGHVIKHLEASNAACSYFFFKHGDTEGSSVSALLRSLAYQMADSNSSIRHALLSMVNEKEYFNKGDERLVWKTLFQTRILPINLQQPQYWIIDALDECANYTSLLQLLSKAESCVPLRIFITSRPLPSVERALSQDRFSLVSESIKKEDTLNDIRLLLLSQADLLPVEPDSRQSLVERIVEKSGGSFLWASLILKELGQTYSEQQIEDVLNQVPVELDDVYHRILDSIQAMPRIHDLAKAILRWTVCAARPLSVDELKEALMLDIGHAIPRLETVAGSITGYLVEISTDGKIQLIHETVKAFLTRQKLESEFAIERRKEQSRLAEVCLTYLCGDSFKASKRQRLPPSKQSADSGFASYAATYFSYHLTESSSPIDPPLILLNHFFRTTALGWIEWVARAGDLSILLQTSRNLKAYLDRRAKYRSPLGSEVQRVQMWADDLIRVVAAFGTNILSAPGAIHSLIPPLCPPKSMIYRDFKDSSRSLEVVGISDEEWDDRISCIISPEGQALSIAGQSSCFAVGLSTGLIRVFKSTTFEESKLFNHSEPVRHVCFSKTEDLLASSGRRKLKLWDPQAGVQLWETSITGIIVTMSFVRDDGAVMIAMRENKTLCFDTKNGEKLLESAFYDIKEGNDDETTIYMRQPIHICVCPELNILGVAYRQRPISFWDLDDNSWLSNFHKGDPDIYPGPLLVGLTINPNPELELAAATYHDGDLVVFNLFDGQPVASVEASAQILAASPDGRTLATGDGAGTIQLFNFETLRLLYRLSMYDFDIRAITFSSDNLRFYDIRSNHCNIWEPPVLVRKENSDDNLSEPYSDEVPHPARLVDHKSFSGGLTITAICEHHTGNWVFVGRVNGSLAVYDATTGKEVQELIGPMAIAIKFLVWNAPTNVLAISDTSSRLSLRTLTLTDRAQWQISPAKMNARAEEPIRQLICNPSGKFILVSTDTLDQVWDIELGTLAGAHARLSTKSNYWLNLPGSEKYVVLIELNQAHIFEWEGLRRSSRPAGIDLVGLKGLGSELGVQHAISTRSGRSLCLLISASHGSPSPELQVYLTSSIDAKIESTNPIARYVALRGRIKAVLGVHKSDVIFLDPDGWVCSLNIDSFAEKPYYTQHFFIPFLWHNVGEIVFAVTVNGSVALARRDELVVFHHGLDYFGERVAFDPSKEADTSKLETPEVSGAVKFSRRRRPAARPIRSGPDPGPIGIL